MKCLIIIIAIHLVVYQASSLPTNEAHGREIRAAFNGDWAEKAGCIGPGCQHLVDSQCPGGNCAHSSCPGGNCGRSACPGGNCGRPACLGGNCGRLACPGGNCGRSACPGGNCGRSACPGGNCGRSACPGGNCGRSACPGGNCGRSACPGGNCGRSACAGGSCNASSRRFLDIHIHRHQAKRSADPQCPHCGVSRAYQPHFHCNNGGCTRRDRCPGPNCVQPSHRIGLTHCAACNAVVRLGACPSGNCHAKRSADNQDSMGNLFPSGIQF